MSNYRAAVLTVFILSATIWILFAGNAFAVDETQHNNRIADAASRLAQLEQGIKESNDSVVDVGDYLYHALLMVYTGKTIANHKFDDTVIQTNDDLTQLVDLGIIPFWPDNPLTWEPMEVLGTTDGFSAGNLCFELCPFEYYTEISTGLAPVSFNLYVYGLDEFLSPFGELYIYGHNKDWYSRPSGVAYAFSMYTTPQSVIDEAYKAYRERIEAEEINPESEESSAE